MNKSSSKRPTIHNISEEQEDAGRKLIDEAEDIVDG